MTETRKFVFLLNAMEWAAQSNEPAKEGYAEKRAAVLAYVGKLEQGNAALRMARDTLKKLADAAATALESA